MHIVRFYPRFTDALLTLLTHTQAERMLQEPRIAGISRRAGRGGAPSLPRYPARRPLLPPLLRPLGQAPQASLKKNKKILLQS
jgi:hypothetical protein